MTQLKHQFEQTKSTNIHSVISGPSTANHWHKNTDAHNPQNYILHDYRYTRLYDQFLKDNEKLQSIVKASKEEKQCQSIKSFISRSLSVKKKQDEFDEKFSSQFKLRKKKPIMTMNNALNTITQKIGETDEVKAQNEKKLFFSQTKKVLQLQEDCLLLEYYYKDRSQFVPKNITNQKTLPSPNISYLRTRNHTEARHKRNQPNQQQSQKLYLTHNQPYFQKRKTINYVKEQKFKNESYRRAEMNYQFRREKNFAQMAEITKQNRQNLLVQNGVSLSSTEVKEKQQKFNRVMKLFLRFAYIQQTKRAYYDYIDTDGMQKWTTFLVDNEFSPKLTKQTVSSMIEKIVKYKSQKRLQFYDFVEFLDTVNETLSINLLNLIEQKHPHLFIYPEEKYLNDNWQQIKKQMTSKKIKFTLKLVFESAGNVLVLGKYLPIKQIPRILSNLGISGNDIPRNRLFQVLFWNQHRPQGLSFHEFFFAFLMLGVKDNSYENVFSLMNKLKIGQILQ